MDCDKVGVVWYDVVRWGNGLWYRMVWYGLVWHGMVWCVAIYTAQLQQSATVINNNFRKIMSLPYFRSIDQ